MYTKLFISFLTALALRVSGAICTHHQEHNCSVQPQVCMVLVCYCIGAGRAGLCPWDNQGKANSWRPPRPVHKNVKKKIDALQYCDNNEFIGLTVGTSRVLMSKAATNNICSNKHKA
jgi:hypothetical protein